MSCRRTWATHTAETLRAVHGCAWRLRARFDVHVTPPVSMARLIRQIRTVAGHHRRRQCWHSQSSAFRRIYTLSARHRVAIDQRARRSRYVRMDPFVVARRRVEARRAGVPHVVYRGACWKRSDQRKSAIWKAARRRFIEKRRLRRRGVPSRAGRARKRRHSDFRSIACRIPQRCRREPFRRRVAGGASSCDRAGARALFLGRINWL